LGAIEVGYRRPSSRVVEQQIGGTKDLDLNLHNIEDESLLLSCKISFPITFFSLSSPCGGSI
jgi:hypothetical protein